MTEDAKETEESEDRNRGCRRCRGDRGTSGGYIPVMNWVVIELFASEVDANIAKGKLETEGLMSSIQLNQRGDTMLGTFGMKTRASDILVLEKEAECARARSIINSRRQASLAWSEWEREAAGAASNSRNINSAEDKLRLSGGVGSARNLPVSQPMMYVCTEYHQLAKASFACLERVGTRGSWRSQQLAQYEREGDPAPSLR